jgi:hypothetical protein
MIEATLPAPCVSPIPGCPGAVQKGQAWDVAHLVDYVLDPLQPLTPSSVGPAHSKCNRVRGGHLGRARQKARRRNESNLPEPDSGW